MDLKALNLLDEIIYVSELDTYNLIFVSEKLKSTFNIKDLELKNAKCYKVLQGFDSPCSFCTNNKLKYDEFYEWDHYNKVVQRYYTVKDKLIKIDNVDARLEMAFDVTKKSQETNHLRSLLEIQTTVYNCLRILDASNDISVIIPKLLAEVGSYLGAERANLFMIEKQTMKNMYEWCANEHIKSYIADDQEISVDAISQWYDKLSKGECIAVRDTKTLKKNNPAIYEYTLQRKTTSLVIAPLIKDNLVIGHIGVDDPDMDKFNNAGILLLALSNFIVTAINDEKNKQLLENLSTHDLLTNLYNRNKYIEDLASYELLYRNKKMGIVFIDANGLKKTNDKYGHYQGDLLLITIADNIRKVFKEYTIYRIGGDEFVVVCPTITREELIEKVKSLRTLCTNKNKSIASIGYSYTSSVSKLDNLINDADKNMYYEKNGHPKNISLDQ